MRDWAVCTIGTTARLEINRFEKACAFEPYGSQCRLIPTRRRDLAAAKTATPGGWPHLRIGNLLSEHFPGTFCIVANDTSHRTAVLCHQNISSHLSTSKLRFAEQNSVTPSDSLQCASSNHRRSHKIRLRGNTPHPPRPLLALSEGDRSEGRQETGKATQTRPEPASALRPQLRATLAARSNSQPPFRGNAPHPPRPLTAVFFLKNVKGQMPAVHRPYFGWYECRRVHLAVVRAELR